MKHSKSLFSSSLRKLRIEQNLTQEQAAEQLEITLRCFQNWESGVSLPDFEHLCFLVYRFDFDLYTIAAELFSYHLLQQENEE